MLIVWYISGHGFGHASRDIEVINALAQRRPDVEIIIRSSVAEWLLRMSAKTQFDLQACEVDTGVAQIDSLTIDEDETVRRAARFYSDFDRRANEEAWLLKDVGASLVVGDVPPLAFAAADRAAIPSVAIANFTWDWIYAAYPQFEWLAPGTVDIIRSAYAKATVTLRLPLHGGFETMAPITDIRHIARLAARSRGETRAMLGIADAEPVVLASFGGFGLRLPYDRIAEKNGLTLVVTDHEAGTSRSTSDSGSKPGRLLKIDRQEMRSRSLSYEDLVAASDVVMTKPGYGIVSECIGNNVALLYTSRGHFVEYDVMVAEMPRVLRCRHIARDDFLEGNWSTAVRDLLAQPPAPESAATNGAEIAAEHIARLL